MLWNDLYPAFLDAGYDINLFWECTILEIQDLLESFQRKERYALKNSALTSWLQTKMIANHISKMMDEKNQVKLNEIWDYYPGLFDEEKQLFKVQQEEQDFDNFKQSRRAYAKRMKAKMEDKGGDTT